MLKRITTYIATLLYCTLTGTAIAQDNDSIRALYYFQKFQDYEYVDTMLARKYSDSCLIFAYKTDDPELKGRAHQFKGWYFQDCSKFKDANKNYYKSLAFLKEAGHKQGIADAYGNLGNSYLDMEEFRKSLNYQLLSLKENEKIIQSNPPKEQLEWAIEGKTFALHNIASIYQDIELFDKALEYEYKSILPNIEIDDPVGAAISYNTLGSIHKSMNNIDSAIYYFKRAISIFKDHDYPYGYSGALQSYASMEETSLSESEKKEMLEKALELRRSIGDVDGEGRVLITIADTWFDQLSLDSLSTIVESIYTIIEENDLEILNEKYYLLYSRYSSRLGKYDSAYFALENFLELKALSDEKKRTHDLIAQDIKYQWEIKHYKDSLEIENGFAVERLAHQEQLNRKQNIIYLSVIGFILLILSLTFFINSNRRRKRMNELLTEKNNLINEQKAIVEEKNRSISDSINYAKRLQDAILPTADIVNEYLPTSCLFYQPKDIVSGDFHWFEVKNERIYIAAADCTGHGVPGALVSVVCSNALNRALNEFELAEPKDILDKTRELVIEQFAMSHDNVKDGMDIALCAIDKRKKMITFSGANNPVWIVRHNDQIEEEPKCDSFLNGERSSVLEFKGDKQPVGDHHIIEPFTQRAIQMEQGDTIYLFTDGYADQFGGEAGKKFKYRPFKELLIELNVLRISDQGSRLKNAFNNWKGEFEQTDDVCVIGFKID